MAEVWVETGSHRYPIYIGPGRLARLGQLLAQHLPQVQRILVVTDRNVGGFYANAVEQALAERFGRVAVVQLPPGEATKSLAQAAALYEACVDGRLDRTSAIIALGGGVVGDLAGFVAATYLRGIPFVQVPTSLLAQVDSSVGGKTGVDLPQGKNLVGAFHQPSLVVADIAALQTLPHREVSAGMAEVVKYGVIQDATFLAEVEELAGAIRQGDQAALERVVERSCQLKAAVVAADEREAGLRAILNFGHTVGHAVEAQMGFGGWLHGECVAVGMVAATAIAAELGILQDSDLPQRLKALLTRLDLPVALPEGIDLTALEPLMARDKKVADGRIRWVLPVRAGEVVITPDVDGSVVRRALEALQPRR